MQNSRIVELNTHIKKGIYSIFPLNIEYEMYGLESMHY